MVKTYELQNPSQVISAKITMIDNGHFCTYYLRVDWLKYTKGQNIAVADWTDYFGVDTLPKAKAAFTRDWQRPSQGHPKPIWKEVKSY